MQVSTLILSLVFLSAFSFWLGRKRAFTLVKGDPRKLRSLPNDYGYYVAIWCVTPALLVFLLWSAFETPIITALVVAELPDRQQPLSDNRIGLLVNDIKNLAAGGMVSDATDLNIRVAADQYQRLREISRAALWVVMLSLAMLGTLVAWRRIHKDQRARNLIEKLVRLFLMASASLAILITIGIVLSVLFESLRFFQSVPLTDFLFGLEWSPQMAIREDQVGASGAFGVAPLFAGTLLIASVAMLVAVPIGLMSAIYLSEYAGRRLRATAKPVLEILAGIPTVVYGFFAALTVAPLVREGGALLELEVSSQSALAVGLVMGIMIIPLVSSLSDDVINAVPQAMRDASYALGATRSETIQRVVIPVAMPGIVGGILLAVSRAIGETMIVVMAAGLTANLAANPLEAVTTVTAQIVTLLVGDQEFDSPKTLAAFALGLMLFIVTLVLNVIALRVVRKYREQYE